VEAHPVARAQEQRVLPEHGVPAPEVVDRQRPSDELVAAGRLDRIDREARAADPERALRRPRAGRVVLRDEDRLARVERKHEREPREEADEGAPLLGREHGVVELLAVGEAVVADDVVDVRPALGVRRVLADAVQIALDGLAGLRVVERERQVDEPARDLDLRLRLEVVVDAVQVLDQRVELESNGS
jgi:hypothetical protein